MPVQLFMVTNAAAGSSRSLDAALEALGPGTEVAPCSDAAELPELLAGAAGRPVVVAGGDGSLHSMVRALRASGRLGPGSPLGLIPLGTGNDFARALDLPLDPVQAAQRLLECVRVGRSRALDLAVVDGSDEVVVNAAHVGIGAEAASVAAGLKPTLGVAAYPLGSAVAGLRPGGWRLSVHVDGELLVEDEVLMVGIGNGTTIGGGTALTPDALPDDGLLDVVVSLATGPVARMGFARDLAAGEHPERDDVVLARGTRVRVSGERAGVDFGVNEDGELSGPLRSRAWTLLPGAFSVFA